MQYIRHDECRGFHAWMTNLTARLLIEMEMQKTGRCARAPRAPRAQNITHINKIDKHRQQLTTHDRNQQTSTHIDNKQESQTSNKNNKP